MRCAVGSVAAKLRHATHLSVVLDEWPGGLGGGRGLEGERGNPLRVSLTANVSET